MEKDAERLMGERVLAGAPLATKGTISKMAVAGGVAGAGGVIGAVAAGAVGTALSRGGSSALGSYKGLLYMAVGPSKVGFFAVKRGLLKNSVREMLASAPREQVTSVDVSGGLIPSVTVTFADGSTYALECARVQKGKAEKLKQAMGV